MNSTIEIVAESPGDYLVVIDEKTRLAVSVWKEDLKVHGKPMKLDNFLKQWPYEPVTIVNTAPFIIENVKDWLKENGDLYNTNNNSNGD